jgi:hypothetical protein
MLNGLKSLCALPVRIGKYDVGDCQVVDLHMSCKMMQ